MNERTLQAYLFRSKKKIKKINKTKSSQKFLMLDIKDVYHLLTTPMHFKITSNANRKTVIFNIA